MHYVLRQIAPANPGFQPIQIHIHTDEFQIGRRTIKSLARYQQMSRPHAAFYKLDDGTLSIKDMKSLNGVYVNDVRIGSSLKLLSVGDVIGFGVLSSKAEEGFVCVLDIDHSKEIEPEIVELSDDEDFNSIAEIEQDVIELCSDSPDYITNENSVESDLKTSDYHMPSAVSEICSSNLNFVAEIQQDVIELTDKASNDDDTEKENSTNSYPNALKIEEKIPASISSFSNAFHSISPSFNPSEEIVQEEVKTLDETYDVDFYSGIEKECAKSNSNSATIVERKLPSFNFSSAVSDGASADRNFEPSTTEKKLPELNVWSEASDRSSTSQHFNSYTTVSTESRFQNLNFSNAVLGITSLDQNLDTFTLKNDVKENSEGSTPSKLCVLPLAKCDSKSFESLSTGLLNPSEVEISLETEESPIGFRKKRARRISSDSSEAEHETNAKSAKSDNEGDNMTYCANTEIFSCSPTKGVKEKFEAKIKVIDPQPMSYRPRRLRGRDEGFVERKKAVDLSEGVPKRKRGRPRKKPPTENEVVEPKPVGIKPRITRASKRLEQENESVENVTSQNSSFPVSEKPKVSRKKTVKTRPERFSSRMGFLISETNEKCKSNRGKISRNIDASKKKSSDTCKSSINTRLSNLKDPRLSRASLPSELDLKNTKVLPVSAKVQNTAEVFSIDYLKKTHPGKAYDVSFLGMVKTVIKLDTNWLQQQVSTEIVPSLLLKGVVDLPLTYKSLDSYVSSFYPIYLLEMWEFMVESKANLNSRPFYFSILSHTKKKDFIELKCESVVNKKACFLPKENGMAVLEIENNSKISPLFAYVFKHKVDPLNLDSLKASHWKNLPKEWLQDAKNWTFYAYVQRNEMTFPWNTILKGNGVCYMRNKLRLADALCSLKVSPLLTDILQPRALTFLVKPSTENTLPISEYTIPQIEIISSITAAINEPITQPKIILLSGAPGTGKTHSIIGILEILFFNSKHNLKILITAPSDVVVDEIGSRLIELNERYGWRSNSLKFVRIGSEEYIHPRMHPYHIEKKAIERQKLMFKSRERVLQNFRTEISNLEKQETSVDQREKLKCLKDQYEFVKNKASPKKNYYNTHMALQADILRESHVVLSTLSDCGTSLLLRTFKPNSDMNFSCCIVDDSTSCTEIEILQPLMFGMNKLILVGDCGQLPAKVFSKISARHGLERSLFDRFQNYFESVGEESPALVLNEQFRMHSSICDFPSRHIYASKLVTHPDPILKYKDFPLYPFAVLNIMESQESIHKLFRGDVDEAQIVLSICKFLFSCVDFACCSIGIIVSDKAQRSLYLEVLYPYPSYKEIEIDTVEAFQGREKDIVIVSTLKADTKSEGTRFLKSRRRFTVAITRAKKCLIICTQSATLNSYPEWAALIQDSRERSLHFDVASSSDVSSVLKACMLKKS